MGCGLCAINCPTNIIEMTAQKNKQGYNTCKLTDSTKCTNCKICELQCPYGAIEFIDKDKSSFPKLLDGIEIPFHSGCFQGLIEKQLARVIEELQIEKDVIVFKNTSARFALNVQMVLDNHYFDKAIAYQKEHPHQHIIVFLIDEEPWQHQEAIEKLIHLDNVPITIIHMLNYFSNLRLDKESNEYAKDVLDMLNQKEEAYYLSRHSFNSPKETHRTTQALKKALTYQMNGKGYNIVEIILPCHFRLMEHKAYTHIEVKDHMQWFDEEIVTKYPLKVYIDKSI